MKHCRACDVDVATPAVLCPLCGTPLAGLADADCAAVYPPAGSRKEYNFVKRLLLLLSAINFAKKRRLVLAEDALDARRRR